MTNHRIVFINSHNKEETLAEFLFGDDMKAFFTSDHFKEEYKDSKTWMQSRTLMCEDWETYS